MQDQIHMDVDQIHMEIALCLGDILYPPDTEQFSSTSVPTGWDKGHYSGAVWTRTII